MQNGLNLENFQMVCLKCYSGYAEKGGPPIPATSGYAGILPLLCDADRATPGSSADMPIDLDAEAPLDGGGAGTPAASATAAPASPLSGHDDDAAAARTASVVEPPHELAVIAIPSTRRSFHGATEDVWEVYDFGASMVHKCRGQLAVPDAHEL